MTTRIRIAQTPEDYVHFRDLVVEYEESLPEDLKHSDFPFQIDDLESHYGPPNAAFIASVDAAPGGCVALTGLNASTGIVKKLYVKPEYRSLGLARGLMAELTGAARDRGMARLVLDTERERLPAAYKLYLSLGFVECEPYGDVDYESPTYMQLELR